MTERIKIRLPKIIPPSFPNDDVKWPLGMVSIDGVRLPLCRLNMKEFAEHYPRPDHLKQIASNKGSNDLHIQTESGLRVTLQPDRKLMVDTKTGAYSIWQICDDD